MANWGFGITPAALYKVTGNSNTPWDYDQRMNCYMADGISQLNDDKAKGQFVGCLNKLGLKLDRKVVPVPNVVVESYVGKDKTQKKMSSEDKRKAIALKVFGDETKANLLAPIDGAELDMMYNTNVKSNKDSQTFVLYRITLADMLIYRISSEGEDIADIASKAIDYVIKQKGVDPALFENGASGNGVENMAEELQPENNEAVAEPA